jgi:ADP-ribose pyrophosphatase YjhB (NUDIX family)
MRQGSQVCLTGNSWTFAKGGAKPGENPHDVAHREVAEETGHDVEVIGHVPGRHSSGYSSSYFYLMKSKGQSRPHDKETASLKWATPAEARKLIGQTENDAGRERDLALLDAAVKAHAELGSGAKFHSPPCGPVVRDSAYWNATVVFDGAVTDRLTLFSRFDGTPGMNERVAFAVLDGVRAV